MQTSKRTKPTKKATRKMKTSLDKRMQQMEDLVEKTLRQMENLMQEVDAIYQDLAPAPQVNSKAQLPAARPPACTSIPINISIINDRNTACSSDFYPVYTLADVFAIALMLFSMIAGLVMMLQALNNL
ncbi:uncharacterized protein LOC131949016 [Physella acuta]|uniref:uncharacterized protein LOC131949016 n=1 Tax=Physella acuta TaxID=109671 RepID=UPI0027DCAC76|nr:uncharacterized protein LOC131949016 [Physella acuta]